MAPKRQRPDSNPGIALEQNEHRIYEFILSKEGSGIWPGDIKNEIQDIPANAISKIVKVLEAKKLIKSVVNINSKSKKRVMGIKFQPSKEVSGGSWYKEDGQLDEEFIKFLRLCCLNHLKTSNVTNADSILKAVEDLKVFETKITKQQIVEICGAMVLDGQIEEVKSGGRGGPYYRFLREKEEPKVVTFASIPCGACSRINDCTPEGIISPQNCVYYNKWLGLDF